MSPYVIEAAKILVPAMIGVIGGYLIKRWEIGYHERKSENDLWSNQRQDCWSPLLESTLEFRKRLERLSAAYRNDPNAGFTADSLSADFRELYGLTRNAIPNFQDYDASQPRREQATVQRTRARMCHELTFAESSVYVAARYLGYAEHASTGLGKYTLTLSDATREHLRDGLLRVREALQGPGGAGVFQEQQEYIGAAVWGSNGSVVSNMEFRNGLLELPGWERFTNLLRFFADFAPKVDYEVLQTIRALTQLEGALTSLCQCPNKNVYDDMLRHTRAGVVMSAAVKSTASV
jgi:hypothetical protein